MCDNEGVTAILTEIYHGDSILKNLPDAAPRLSDNNKQSRYAEHQDKGATMMTRT